MKKMAYSICCSEKICAVVEDRSLRLKCEGCGVVLLEVLSRWKIDRAEQLSAIDRLRASNLVNSGRYCRTNILQSIRESHQNHSKPESHTVEEGLPQRPRRNLQRLGDIVSRANNQSTA